jgi:Cu/Ag efflux protein CusF
MKGDSFEYRVPFGADYPQLPSAKTPGRDASIKGTIHERQIVATVEEVDAAKGRVTLKGPKGNVLPLMVGPEVRNLAQVKVGDKVRASYVDALSLTLKKEGKELLASKETSTGVRTPAGASTGGAVGEQVTVTADVIAVNEKTHTVTLRGPNQTVDLYVEDPKQLKLIKVGDQLEAVYAQAVAITVEPAAAKK